MLQVNRADAHFRVWAPSFEVDGPSSPVPLPGGRHGHITLAMLSDAAFCSGDPCCSEKR